VVDVGPIGTIVPLESLMVTAEGFIFSTLDVIEPPVLNITPFEASAVSSSVPPIANTSLTSTTTPPPAPNEGDTTAPPTFSPPPPPGEATGTESGPPEVPTGAAGGAPGTTFFLTSVNDLDAGVLLFASIEPATGPDNGTDNNEDPLTVIAPVTPAPLADPPPAEEDTPLCGDADSRMFQHRTLLPRFTGVPGIEDSASGAGNRSLWFLNRSR
jgi:hypothetical protein